MDQWLRFVLGTLAVWRVSHLLAYEDGPWNSVAILREGLGRHGGIMDCFKCLSIWVALPFAWLLDGGWVVWLALSGAAILLGERDGLVLRESSGRIQGGAGGSDDRGTAGTGTADSHSAGTLNGNRPGGRHDLVH